LCARLTPFGASLAARYRKIERWCAAAILAALPLLDGCAFADMIDLVYELLRPPVGHVHRSGS